MNFEKVCYNLAWAPPLSSTTVSLTPGGSQSIFCGFFTSVIIWNHSICHIGTYWEHNTAVSVTKKSNGKLGFISSWKQFCNTPCADLSFLSAFHSVDNSDILRLGHTKLAPKQQNSFAMPWAGSLRKQSPKISSSKNFRVALENSR